MSFAMTRLLPGPSFLLVAALILPATTWGQSSQARTTDRDLAVPPTPSPMPTTARRPSLSDVGRRFTEPPNPPRELNLDVPRIDRPENAERPTYTLDDLLSLASQNNPTILQARLHINATLAQAMQAGLYPNPVLNYSGEQIGVGGTAGEWLGATLRQRFVTAGKLELSRRKYLQRSMVAEHPAVAQQFRVCNDVRIHYFKTLAAYEVMALRAELLKTAEDNLATRTTTEAMRLSVSRPE